jgi:hypothetical protein
MATIVFRCPNTGVQVQGWFADDGSENDGETYDSVTRNASKNRGPRDGLLKRAQLWPKSLELRKYFPTEISRPVFHRLAWCRA